MIISIIIIVQLLICIKLSIDYFALIEIQKDVKLTYLFFEIRVQKKDSWTKKHYVKLFLDRLNEIKYEKGISSWRWWIYRWALSQKIKR